MNTPIHILSSSLLYQTLVFLVFLVTYGQSLSFNITRFDGNTQNITYRNDSTFGSSGELQLTKSNIGVNPNVSAGRASYSQPMRLWDKTTNKTTDFSTHFTFAISTINSNSHGDGMAFFLTPFDDSTEYAPYNSSGGTLGFMTRAQVSSNMTRIPFVAVEFDTYRNGFDPGNFSDDHLGIDVSNVISRTNVTLGPYLRNNSGSAWITYDSSTMNLSVHLTDLVRPVPNVQPSLSYIIDLRSVLPERVRVGFSAATGAAIELHSISSWSFSSTLPDYTEVSVSEPRKSSATWVIGLVAGITVLIFALGSLALVWWRKRYRGKSDDIISDVDGDFDQETGPKRFTYNELSRATNYFSEKGKLGQGGFGGVYKGFLTDVSKDIAVKKISKGSNQGKKEYVSEVKIISRLRHKNLVQLLGWCHERGELLLVYEYMPNGSLDCYLHKSSVLLPWADRYKIAQGLASALLYLHEDWEQCVLHRDIKPSNVMLDSSFNAKLGDFGLARFVDHNLGSHTTLLAGTIGYIAPECVQTGKSSKESDLYSFGVVALEIACGRRPIIESKDESIKASIIDWVWDLYGEDCLLQAAYGILEGEFDQEQMKRLMIVGLWCCHPDYTLRPSIRQVVNVLNFENSLPSLPKKLPVPVYDSTPMNASALNITTTSSSGFTGSSIGTTSSSSHSIIPGAAPLLSENDIL